MGIGHKVKSKYNPDSRCSILAHYVERFPCRSHYDFAKEVEKRTLEKKPTLILNVDGHIAVMLLDMLVGLGMDHDTVQHYLDA